MDAAAADEPVLLGAAMLGAVAGGVFPDLASAMPAMSRVLTTHHPDPDSQRLHAARHRAFLTLQATAATCAATSTPH